ncbi:MAG: hypothetical protein GXX01_09175 [Clostridiales bacterium]|nr:hypothetical protein [Clostridiales bacterium]
MKSKRKDKTNKLKDNIKFFSLLIGMGAFFIGAIMFTLSSTEHVPSGIVTHNISLGRISIILIVVGVILFSYGSKKIE